MASLAQLPELVGFFSYSREDDEAFRGSLSALRDAILRELSAGLGRSDKNFRLWQDQDAIAPGEKWKSAITSAIERSVFFIPIITPRAVASEYCKFEFESFLARERALGRNDLVFPIHYIEVPALKEEAEWRDDPVLSIVAERQYVDWRNYRRRPVDAPDFGQEIEVFCSKIIKKLRWLPPMTPLTAAQERSLKAGDSFKEGADCPEMIVVPAGRFLMGSTTAQGNDRELPQHEVTIAKPFAVAKFALTFGEWDACAARGACRRNVDDRGWGRGRRPVINVSWDDARAYIKWLSSITGKPYRLLSETEWEYAARAGSQTDYPWGDEIMLNGKAMANCNRCGSQWDDKQTALVGSFAANAFGLHDMVGNVWEWTEDCWHESYQGAPTDGSPWTSGYCERRIVRGGSWNDHQHCLRSAYRGSPKSDGRSSYHGFRVARTLTP
jgi:formylglycine-generating enzyme required for sulfatase activity